MKTFLEQYGSDLSMLNSAVDKVVKLEEQLQEMREAIREKERLELEAAAEADELREEVEKLRAQRDRCYALWQLETKSLKEPQDLY